jgi:hypothetical protein
MGIALLKCCQKEACGVGMILLAVAIKRPDKRHGRNGSNGINDDE